MCLWAQTGHRLHHVVEGVTHSGGVGYVQCDAVHVRLVADVWRVDFECHRVAQLGGNHHGLAGGAGQNGLCDLDVEGRQQGFGFHLGEHIAALGQYTFDQQAGTFDVWFGQRRQRWRCLQQHLLVLIERRDVAERTHSCFGCAEVGHAGFAQGLAGCLHGRIAHPAGQQGFAQFGAQLGQRFGHRIGVATDFGGVNGQQAVDLAVFGGGFQCGGVALGAGIFRQVNQAVGRCQWPQFFLQLFGRTG